MDSMRGSPPSRSGYCVMDSRAAPRTPKNPPSHNGNIPPGLNRPVIALNEIVLAIFFETS